MTVRRIVFFVIAVGALVGLTNSSAFAQDHSHGVSAAQGGKAAELVKAVREVTDRFQDVKAAEAEGYALNFGCVSGPDFGAMGLHYINGPLVGDAVIDVNKPEIILYEAQPNGKLKLTGADYLVFADAWNATHSSAPELMGQLFQFFDSPNRFGLPPFYTLHVWAWKESPTGTFVNWNANISCDAFKGQN